ncbi:hypothetical protein MTR67_008860 [Solanum verrucosum]|uniref:Uncharacterized protein n=1 Tax=Solanum verrucosum TaxID=315347 RepID=A0AAF0TJS9_SOLVR|nr:hypothetical protein MTR67_008860 [Solanum verrucosum]
MALLPMPSEVIEQIDKIRRDFLWKATGRNTNFISSNGRRSHNQNAKEVLALRTLQPTTKAADKLKWGHQKGVYTVKEGYQQLCSRNSVIANWPWKLIWRTKLPPKARGSLERDDEVTVKDVYFDDESAEVVISSLRLGDDQESGSLFTNSNWFAFEDDKEIREQYTALVASPSPDTEETNVIRPSTNDDAAADEDDDLADTASSDRPEPKQSSDHPSPSSLSEDLHQATSNETIKPPEWVEWRESSSTIGTSNQTSDSAGVADVVGPPLPNGDVKKESEAPKDTIQSKEENAHIPPTNGCTSNVEKESEGSSGDTSQPPETDGSQSSSNPSSGSMENPPAGTVGLSSGETEK